MTLKQKLLSLLIAQVALIVVLFLAFQPDDLAGKATNLLGINRENITKLVIRDENDSVTLLKKGKNWHLPEFHELPVNNSKLNQLLTKFTTMHVDWPVTTSDASHERFEVSADKYQRSISFYQNDDEQAELFLGTSPAFRKVHSRLASADNVYSIEFNTYEAPAASADWYDKSLLSVNNIVSIKTDAFSLSLSKDGENWQFDNMDADAEDKVIDQSKVTDWISSISRLSVTGVAEDGIAAPSNEQTNGNLKRFSIGSDKGEITQFTLFEVDDKYYVKSGRYPQVFTISKNDFTRLTKVTIEDFSETKSTDEALEQSKNAKEQTSDQ